MLEEISKAILNSVQLEEKAKNFKIIETKYLGKEIDNFSFTLEDLFKLNFQSNDGNYKIDCPQSENDISDYWYVKLVTRLLTKPTIHNQLIKFTNRLKISNLANIYFNFDLKIRHDFEKDNFEIQSISKNDIRFIQRSENKIAVMSILDDKIFILGEINSKDDSILDSLNEIREYFFQLEKKLVLSFEEKLIRYSNEYHKLEKEPIICKNYEQCRRIVNERRNDIDRWLDNN